MVPKRAAFGERPAQRGAVVRGNGGCRAMVGFMIARLGGWR